MSATILQKLSGLAVGGCTCMTKTPELQYHDELCRYRIVVEAEREITRLQTALRDSEVDLMTSNAAIQHLRECMEKGLDTKQILQWLDFHESRTK